MVFESSQSPGIPANRNSKDAGRRRKDKDTTTVEIKAEGAKLKGAPFSYRREDESQYRRFNLDPIHLPQRRKNEKTVNAYVEALNIGAQFPPIKIQRVFNYADGNETTEATLILDGIHRWFAFKESEFKKIEAVEWKDKPLDYEKNKVALLLESA